MASLLVSPWVEFFTALICSACVYPAGRKWWLEKQAYNSAILFPQVDTPQGELFDLRETDRRAKPILHTCAKIAPDHKPRRSRQPSLLDLPTREPIIWPTSDYTRTLALEGSPTMLSKVAREMDRLPQSRYSERHALWMSIIQQAAAHQTDGLKQKDLIPLVADELELSSDSVVEKLIKSTHLGAENLFGQIVENLRVR